MRYLFIFFTLFSFQINAQSGSIYVRCLNSDNGNPISTLVLVKKDTTVLDSGETDDQGRIKFSNLPIGRALIQFQVAETAFVQREVFIQDKQMYQMVVELDDLGSSSGAGKPNTYKLSHNANEELVTRSESYNLQPGNGEASILNAKGVQSIQEVQIVAYSNPLINKQDACSMVRITRNDIRSLPMRSATSIAGTAGGVYQNELNQDLYIRGSRADASAYYVDGMRVTDLYGMPKASIGEVKIITGGIPASYGDLTGGIVAVESRSYFDGPPVAKPQITSGRANVYAPEPSLNLDRFASIYENAFLSTVVHPNSTFGIDVDRASWSYIKRRYSERGQISRDAVKLEEMINAFKYKDVSVPENELMHVEIDRSSCAWNEESELVTIHLQARDIPQDLPRKPHNFVFLIDVSGSMSDPDKLGLVKQGMIGLVETLGAGDRVAIVTYSNFIDVPLNSTTCDNKREIKDAINSLNASGSTNGSGGIQEAYKVAEANYDPMLNNRIVLCTDGDFNVGISNTGDLEKYIAQKRGSGIYLTALGVGIGNHRNDILETLADRGDGNHFYLNDIEECEKVLIDEIGNLINIARDVKLNVEFNPKLVEEYRLIGYENRLLKPRDFEDDSKDAGEIGYNHSVTAVYEIKRGKAEKENTHFTKTKLTSGRDELAYVKLRYKSFEDSLSIEKNFTLLESEPIATNELVNIVASFGLLLRDSAFKGEMSPDKLKAMVKKFRAKSEDELELKAMIEQL